jgi:hypothetical protein
LSVSLSDLARGYQYPSETEEPERESRISPNRKAEEPVLGERAFVPDEEGHSIHLIFFDSSQTAVVPNSYLEAEAKPDLNVSGRIVAYSET